MSTIYITTFTPESKANAQRFQEECKLFLEAECLLSISDKEWDQNSIRTKLDKSDVLVVVIDENIRLNDKGLSDRIRFELVTAIHLDLMIVPILVDDAQLPNRSPNAPGTFKTLQNAKSYKLRSPYWSEDIHELLDDIQSELDFRKEVEDKLSRSSDPNFLGLGDEEGKPLKPHGLGLEFSSALELRRIIESERHNLDQARRKGDRDAEKKSLSVLGLTFSQMGQTQQAIHYFKEQLAIAREMNDLEEQCSLLANLGDACAVSGNIDNARGYYQEQLMLADSEGFSAHIASSFNGLGFVYVKSENIPKAIECYFKSLELYKRLEDHEKILELLVGIGLNHQKLGDLKQAAEFLEQAGVEARYLENRKEEAQICVDLAELYIQLGQDEKVMSVLTRAEDIFKHQSAKWAHSWKNKITTIKKGLNKRNI